jgi:hypothetical protein
MAPTRNATAARGRLDSGDLAIDSPEPRRDGRADPAPALADRRFPSPFQEVNMTEAAIIDKSGNTSPNIGHFS